jgi:type I restriction enzyme S subunit
MSEWKEYKLKELFEIPLKNGLNKPSKVRGLGFRMVNMKEIFGYNFIGDETPMELVPLEEREREFLKFGDLLFARQSLVASGAGKVAYYRGFQPTVFESHLIRCRLNNKANSLYFYYLIKSQYGRGKIETIVEQTAAAGIRGSDLKELKFIIPDLPTQTAIAEILSSLDDKIELNNKINQELENLAQTLFKQWFIDFEFPNENGEPYKSSGGEMVDSELGEIPEGWEIEKLMNRIENTKSTPKSGIPLQNRKYVPIDKMAIKSLIINNYSPIEDAKSSLVLFEKGDILLGAMRVYFHRVNYCPFDGVTRTTCFVLRPYQKSEVSFFLLYLNQNETIEYANRTSKGTTMPYAVWEDGLAELKFVYPTSEITNLFNDNITELLNFISENIKENIELTNLRDTLLPKLISGELEINEISK